jgi:hypothetical protein
MHELFEDDTYFYIREDNYVFLDVLEHNTQDEVENFEIEVFKVEKESNPNVSDGGTLREVLIPLKFFKKDENINPYSEDEILDTALAPTGLDETFVEYYFDIEVDNGIGPEVLCELLSRHRRNKQFDGMFSDLDVDLSTDCEDFRFMHEIGSKSNVLSTTENVNASEEECE